MTSINSDMTHTATVFVLTSTGTGQAVAFGLVCPEARYCGVLVRGADRVDRRFATPTDWQALEREIREGLPPTPLGRQTACGRLLAGDAAVTVQWMWAKLVDVGEPGQTAQALDALLLAAASKGAT